MVLDNNGNNLGCMFYRDAQELAVRRDLDLVQVNKTNKGPVVYKIMDHGKHKYDKKKHKQKNHSQPLKEIKIKMRIDPHDLDIKIMRIKQFIQKGSDVKITVSMRGREQTHPQLAQQKIDFILKDLEDTVSIQQRRLTKSSIFVTVRPVLKKGSHAPKKEKNHSDSINSEKK